MIADTHIHIWDFQKAHYSWLDGNMTILNRSYHVTEIEPERKKLNIASGVLVQAANNLEDTNWMLQVADSTEWIKAVVGWLPLTDPAATQKLLEEKYLKNKFFKGVRHLIHDEADPKWLLQPAVIESLRLLAAHNISYDVVGVLPEHIRTVLKAAEHVSNLQMIFDHLNHPRSGEKEIYDDWKSMMKVAAENKNFYVKISGLATACGVADWENDDLKPAIEMALQNFGVNRCLCGGDWPVSLLAGNYTKTWTAYQQIINELLPEKEAAKIFYTNAQQFYKL